MNFEIYIQPEVYQDIQQATDWYNQQVENLGYKFCEEVDKIFELIRNSPYFQIHYDQVRCIPLKKFPYMVHFTVHELEKIIVIQSIVHTPRYPRQK